MLRSNWLSTAHSYKWYLHKYLSLNSLLEMLNFLICSSGESRLAARSQPPCDRLFETLDNELLLSGSLAFAVSLIYAIKLRKSSSSEKLVTFCSKL